MQATKETPSHDDLVTQFNYLARHARDHNQNAHRIHSELLEHLSGKAATEAISKGGKLAPETVAKIAALQSEGSMLSITRQPVKEKLAELMPLIFVEAERLTTELESLHKANSDRVYEAVLKRVESAIPKGWLQPSELRWVALRSAPVREQARHEAEHPASNNISLVIGRHPLTGEVCNVPHPDVVENPVVITSTLDRLQLGIGEANKRREQIKRDFAG